METDQRPVRSPEGPPDYLFAGGRRIFDRTVEKAMEAERQGVFITIDDELLQIARGPHSAAWHLRNRTNELLALPQYVRRAGQTEPLDSMPRRNPFGGTLVPHVHVERFLEMRWLAKLAGRIECDLHVTDGIYMPFGTIRFIDGNRLLGAYNVQCYHMPGVEPLEYSLWMGPPRSIYAIPGIEDHRAGRRHYAEYLPVIRN